MKCKTSLMIWVYAVLLCACAGANTPRNPLPPDRMAGMNELKKGVGRYQQGCYTASLEHFFKAHELFSASDHTAGVAMSLNNIGNSYRAIGDPDGALLFYEEAYLLYMDLKDQEGALQSLSNKAAALIDAGKLAAADDEFARAAKITDSKTEAFAPLVKNQGLLLLKKGDYQRAAGLIERALKNTDPLDLPEVAAVNFAMGTVMLKTDRPDAAIRYFQAALSADRSSSYYQAIADDLAAIGSVYHDQGRPEQAVAHYKRAVKIYALIQSRSKLAATMTRLTEASQQAGMNPEITEFFVERWTRGEILEKPCR